MQGSRHGLQFGFGCQVILRLLSLRDSSLSLFARSFARFTCLWRLPTVLWWALVQRITACKRSLLCLRHQQARMMLWTFLRLRVLVARSKACLPWMLAEKLEFLRQSFRWSPKQFGLRWLLNVLTILPRRWPLHRRYQVFRAHRFPRPRRVLVQGAFLLCCPAQRTPFWPLVLELPGLRIQVGLFSLCILLCLPLFRRFPIRRCPLSASAYNLLTGATRDVADRPAVHALPVVDQPFIIGPGFLPVPAKLVSQIVAGKYVDLSELLVVNLVQKDPEPQLLLDGRLVLTSQPKKLSPASSYRRYHLLDGGLRHLLVDSGLQFPPSLERFNAVAAVDSADLSPFFW